MYILNQKAQQELKENLDLLETRDDGWTHIYIDPVSKQRWIEYYPYSSYHGGGPRYLRHEEFPDDIYPLIDSCLTSKNSDDAIGLGTDLSEEIDHWESIIDYLEHKKNIYKLNQLRLFIESLGVLHVINRDSTKGKQFSEIEKDYNKWLQLSERVKFLISKKI